MRFIGIGKNSIRIAVNPIVSEAVCQAFDSIGTAAVHIYHATTQVMYDIIFHVGKFLIHISGA